MAYTSVWMHWINSSLTLIATQPKSNHECFLVEIAVIIHLLLSTKAHAICMRISSHCMRDATCVQCNTDNASGDSSTTSNQEPRTGCIAQACSLACLQGRKCTSFGAGIFVATMSTSDTDVLVCWRRREGVCGLMAPPRPPLSALRLVLSQLRNGKWELRVRGK